MSKKYFFLKMSSQLVAAAHSMDMQQCVIVSYDAPPSPFLLYVLLFVGLVNLVLSFVSCSRILHLETSLHSIEEHAISSGKAFVSMVIKVKEAVSNLDKR